MKKFLSLMLALLCIFALAACDGGTGGAGGGGTNPPKKDLDVFEAAAKDTAPTNITTLTSYRSIDMFGEELTFDGSFVLLVSGNESILDFTYQKLALPEDNAEDYIVTKKGAIAIQGGKSKVAIGDDMGSWETVIPSLQNIAAIRIEKELLPAGYTLSEDGKKLAATLTKAEALAVLGVVIDSVSDIAFEAETNGTFLSKVVISYTASSGADVRIASSYTYGPQTLDFSRFN